MAVDIATIGIAVATNEVKSAVRDLTNLEKHSDSASKSADNLGVRYQKAGMLIGAAAAGAVLALGALVKSSINLADANFKASQSIGIQIEKLTALQHAASQSGVSANSLNEAMKRFSKTIEEATGGGKNASLAFGDIGISLKDAEGNLKSTDALLLEVANRFEGFNDGATKTALAMELFGKSGADLIPLLNGGSKSISDMMQQAEKLGLVMDTQTGTSAEKFNDSLSLMGVKVRGVGNNILKEMLPVMQDLTDIFVNLGENTSITTGLTTAFTWSLKALVSVGLFVSNVLSVIGKNMGAIAAATVSFVKGEFSQSMEILRQRRIERFKEDERYTNSQTKLWNGEYQKAAKNAQKVNEDLDTAKTALVRTTEAEAKNTNKASKAQEDYGLQIAAQIADLKAINALLMQGVALDEARLIVTETRKGASGEQIKALQEQLNIQADIAEVEQARQARLQVWIKTQQKAYDDELKAIDEIKKANERASQDYLRDFKRAEEEIRREQQRTSDFLSRTISDGLMRGFESGANFAEAFRRTLRNTFSTIVLTPVIKFLVDGSGVTGFLQSIAGVLTGQGGTGGGQSGIGGLARGVGNIFTSTNQSIIGGIEGIGAKIANGMGGIRDSIGGFVGANAGALANLTSFAGAALQLSQGNFAGAAGTAIGTALGGPLGGAIGSFLGGAVGSLFGGKKQPPRTVTGLPDVSQAFNQSLSTLIQGFGGDGNVTSSSSFAGRAGGSGYGNLNAMIDGQGFSDGIRYRGAYSEATMQAFIDRTMTTTLIRAIRSTNIDNAFKDLFTGLTKKEDVASTINAVVLLNQNNQQLNDTLGITAKEVALLARESNIAGENLTRLVTTVTGVANELFTIGDAMVKIKSNIDGAFSSIVTGSIPANLKAFDEVLKSLDTTTASGRKDFLGLIELRGQFAEFENQINSMRGGVRGALAGIVSDSERQSMMNEDLAKLFSDLSREVPSSVQELIALGKSIDFTTAEGLNLASVFPTLVNAFQQTKGAVDGLINSLSTNRFSTFADFAIGSSLARQGVSIAQIPSMGAGSQSSGANDNRVAVLLERLIIEVSEMKASTQATADNTLRTTRELEDITGGQIILNTTVA